MLGGDWGCALTVSHQTWLRRPERLPSKRPTRCPRRFFFASSRKGSAQMATYHFGINSGKKGSVLEHARYITREGKFSKHEDLVYVEYGNLPEWAGEDPLEFWRATDKYERQNASVYREYEIALPAELDHEQLKELVRRLVERMVGLKPYLFAIHEPVAALGQVSNPHVHLMFSDRLPDGIARTPQQTF